MHFADMLENEVALGIFMGAAGALLSIPAAAAGQLLKRIPKPLLPRERIPIIMAGVGLVLGWTLGHLPGFDMSHAVHIGIQAGAMSGIAKDAVTNMAKRNPPAVVPLSSSTDGS